MTSTTSETARSPSDSEAGVEDDGSETSVLVVSQLFPPESMAGAHRWEKLLQNAPDTVNSRVVCPQPSVPVGEFERRFDLWSSGRVNGIPVTRLFTYQPVDDRTNFERIVNHVVFALLATVYVLIHGRRYDCVVVQIGPHTTLVPGFAAMLTGCGFVVDVYDLWLDNAVDFGFTNENALVFRLLRRMERYAMERADHLIVLTPTMATQYQAKYDLDAEHVTTIPFGVDAELFDPSAEREERPRIIYTGKLGEGQAFEPFLRGFQRSETDHELVIYGFGERREELRTLARGLGIDDRVRINGPVPREEIPELVASSTISLVPLKTEHTLDYARPTKFLETMALGTPYVASTVSEIEFVTRRSGAGIAVENDPDEIARAIRELVSDPERKREMGERGIEFIERNHQWDDLGEMVANVISRAVRERNRRDSTLRTYLVELRR